MADVYNKDAKKKAINISINSDLLLKAKKYKISISANVGKTLERIKNWEKENQDVIESYNEILKNLSTKVVIPLVLNTKAIDILNPKFTINEIEVYLPIKTKIKLQFPTKIKLNAYLRKSLK